MLRSITLKNFKLHTSTKIDAAPLTVFIGPNNSGKSSIFQAILALRQAASRNDGLLLPEVRRQNTSESEPFLYPPPHQIDPGSFSEILHSGAREIEVSLDGSFEQSGETDIGPGEFSLSAALRENTLSYHSGKVSFQILSNKQSVQIPWDWARILNPPGVGNSSFLFNGCVFEFRGLQNFTFLQFVRFTPRPNIQGSEASDLNAFANSVALIPWNFLQSLHPVFPLRGLEESAYPLTGGKDASLDRLMLADRTLAMLGILAYQNEVLDRVSNWISELLGVRVRTRLVPERRVTITCETSERPAGSGLFSNQGTGAGQLPFILLPIALARHGETVMISEPEVHLHPAAQSQLASLLATVVQRGEKQLLVETHSEHILHSFLHALAKGELKKSDLAIYYFEPKGGTVDARRLEVDDYGRVEGGLPGFFDQSLAEMSDYLEILKKK